MLKEREGAAATAVCVVKVALMVALMEEKGVGKAVELHHREKTVDHLQFLSAKKSTQVLLWDMYKTSAKIMVRHAWLSVAVHVLN